MDWKSVILKFKSGTEKKKRDQWIVLFAAGLLLLLFSASGSGKPAHRKEDLPVSGEVLEKMDRLGLMIMTEAEKRGEVMMAVAENRRRRTQRRLLCLPMKNSWRNV
mgnify:CR=1 FL=1